MRDQIFNMEWVCIGDVTYCFHDSLPQTGEFGVYELGVGFSEDRVKPIYLGQGELYFRLYNHASGRSHEPLKSCLDYWLNNGYSLYCRYKISWSDEAREMEKNLKNLYLYDCNSFY